MSFKQFVFGLVGFVLITALAYMAMNQLTQTNQIQELEAKLQALETNKQSFESENSNDLNKVTRPAKESEEAKKIVDEKAHELTGMESNKTDKSEPIIEGFDPIKGGQFQEMPSKSEKLSDEESKREKLEAIRSQLKEMVTTDPKNIDFNKLDGLLIELQEMGDENGTVGGVSIPQLRKIILQSNKILMTSQNKGLAPGEDKNTKLKEEVETLQELQKGIIVKDD